jgi:hypothetical protein
MNGKCTTGQTTSGTLYRYRYAVFVTQGHDFGYILCIGRNYNSFRQKVKIRAKITRMFSSFSISVNTNPAWQRF